MNTHIVSSKSDNEILTAIGGSYPMNLHRVWFPVRNETHYLAGVAIDKADDMKDALKRIGATYIVKHSRTSPPGYVILKFRLEANKAELAEIERRRQDEETRKAKRAELCRRIDEACARNGLGENYTTWGGAVNVFRLERKALSEDMLDRYFQPLPEPEGRDETRIRDMIRKSLPPGARRECVALADFEKIHKFTLQMNAKITDEAKRFYRAEACRKYGLFDIAAVFAGKEAR